MSEPVEIDVNGLTLRGKLFKTENNGKDLAVLFLHGWTGTTNEAAAKVLADNGFMAMTFSLSGHNDSDGKLEDQTREKSLQEVLAAYDYFRSQVGDRKIVVAGNSYGGYMAALLSAERPIGALQLRVPANYPDDNANQPQYTQSGYDSKVRSWREQKQDWSATKALKALHDFNGDVQVLEAELDELVPHQTIENYIDAMKDKSKLDYHLMKGWEHSLGLDKERNETYQKLLLDWLESQVQ